MIIYWIALPFALLMLGGSISSLISVPGSPRHWVMAAVSISFCALLVWRLWLNSRAIGRAGPFPSRRRFWRIFVPLGLLAIAGLILAGVGVVAVIIAATALRETAPDAIPFTAGAAMLLIGSGSLMCMPILRLLLRSPVAAPLPPEA